MGLRNGKYQRYPFPCIWNPEVRTINHMVVNSLLMYSLSTLRHDFAVGPDDSPDDVIRTMKYLRPVHELRQQWSYNNLVSAHCIQPTFSSQPEFCSDVHTRIKNYHPLYGLLHVVRQRPDFRTSQYEFHHFFTF